MKSAAGYSNATLTEDANENNDICQADTAGTVDISNEDHSYADSSDICAKHDCFNLEQGLIADTQARAKEVYVFHSDKVAYLPPAYRYIHFD